MYSYIYQFIIIIILFEVNFRKIDVFIASLVLFLSTFENKI